MDRNRLLLLAKAKLKMEQENPDNGSQEQAPGLTPENPQGMTFTPDVPPRQQTSILEAAGRGLANAVPFQNEISGAIEKGIGSIGAPEAYQDKSVSDLSQENRDINAVAEEEHPIAFGGAKIVGQLALSAVPGIAEEGLAAKGFQGAAKVANLANMAENPVTAATIQGAFQGASDAGPGNRLLGAATGGIAGGATAGLFKGLSNLRQIGEAFHNAAAESSAATIGLTKNEITNAGEKEMVKIGQMLQDDGVTGNLSKLSTIGKQIEKNSAAENSMLNRKYVIMDKKVPADALPTVQDVVGNLKNMFESGNFPDKRAVATASRKLGDLTTKYAPDAQLKPSVLRELAQTLEDISGKYRTSANPAESSASGLLQDAAGLVRTHIHKLATELGPDFQAAFASNSQRAGLYATARDGIQARLAENFQPTSNISQGIRKALSFSQPAKGAYQAATKAVAGSLDWVSANSKSLGKFAKPLLDAARRGPAASASTHYILMQTNPEYREKFAEVSDNESSGGSNGY